MYPIIGLLDIKVRACRLSLVIICSMNVLQMQKTSLIPSISLLNPWKLYHNEMSKSIQKSEQMWSKACILTFLTFLCRPLNTTAKAPWPMRSFLLYSKSPMDSIVANICVSLYWSWNTHHWTADWKASRLAYQTMVVINMGKIPF